MTDKALHLNQVWTKLDELCVKLWKEDRPSAVGLQVLVEEFRAEVDRAEKTLAAFKELLSIQRRAVEREIHADFEARLAALSQELEDAKRNVRIAEESLARERKRTETLEKDNIESRADFQGRLALMHQDFELAQARALGLERKAAAFEKSLEAKDAEVAALKEAHAKTESDRSVRHIEKLHAYLKELEEKARCMEDGWTEHRRKLEAERQAWALEARKSYEEQAQALSDRVSALHKETLQRENTLTSAQEALGKELEAKEARLLAQEGELQRQAQELDKYRQDLDIEWQAKRWELDEIKRKLQEEVRNVIREYQAKKAS
ncbi:MAG: hypothetical protein HY922_08575 [Elusimicrobia bacterium]|nr:hypothetical protein [Elusimicrobiota bacterium]